MGKKLKLEVEALRVDSFTVAGKTQARGTVRGHVAAGAGEVADWSSCGEVCTCACEDVFTNPVVG